ncbi:MAG: FMN-binding protein, partial [Clostridia bacterium]|nr:FMN-binding protein [Clostridia bacterium]
MTNVANKKQLPAFLVLTIISLIAAVVLAATNEVTKGPIEEHARRAREAAFQAVLPADEYVQLENQSNVYEARIAGDRVDVISGSTMTSNGVISALNQLLPVAVPAEGEAPLAAGPLTAKAPGFKMGDMGGDVGVTVTLNADGTIATLDVDVASQTPSIGDKCADAEWLKQFIGKKGPFSTEAGPVGYCVITSDKGYGGPVAVTLGVDTNGVVTGISSGDANFAET